MTGKWKDFIFSFGMMLTGVILLFVGSVSFNKIENKTYLPFPAAAALAGEGGDLTPLDLPKAKPTVPLAKDTSKFTGGITAVSALVVDDKTGTVLYEKNTQEVRSLASVTKLMSALVLLDLSPRWASTTEILAEDLDASSHHLNAGEKFLLSDLWQVALVGSSNVAINALARESGLARDEFVARMNAKAQNLGLVSARFADPTGLDNRNMAKAGDVALLLNAALAKEKIIKALQTAEYYASPIDKKQRRVWNTNWLLTHWIPSEFKGVQIAGKTGYILDSDYNFVVRLTDSLGHGIRAVILGSASNETRFTEARDLANWVFGHYLWPDDPGYDKLTE